MPNFIDSYVNDRLAENPSVIQVFQVLAWITTHPFISLGIFLFSLIIIRKIIKGLDRFFEVTGLSILKTIFNFIWRIIAGILLAISKLTGWGWSKVFVKKDAPTYIETAAVEIPQAAPDTIELAEASKSDRELRLAEIQNRLESLAREQNELLQEIGVLLSEQNRPLA
jgi:hypothetical protein